MKYTLRHIRTGTEIEKSRSEVENLIGQQLQNLSDKEYDMQMSISLDKLEREGMLKLEHRPRFLIVCHKKQTFSVKRNVSFNKGGTGGITAKIGLPIEMLRAIGVDKESPQIEIRFEQGEIRITKEKI